MPDRFRGRPRFPAIAAIGLYAALVSCASAQVVSPSTAAAALADFPLPAEAYDAEYVNGGFPEKVWIKTRTQSFNSLHYYQLWGGRVWYKGIDPSSGPREWTLLKKTGLPHNSRRPGFREPRRLVELSADADELVVLSDEGRFYRICFDPIFSDKADYWWDAQGWPRQEQLELDERTAGNRSWSIGKRNARVLHYEDAFGVPHHFGTMGIITTYVLLRDGQEIRFGDTGLPSDFSRNLAGPLRGAFVASALCASASTMFVVGESGEAFTRLADFDTVGSDPMFFKYAYRRQASILPGTDYRSNYVPWGLPSEGWRAQPPLPLSGRAAATRRIAILQDGRGNAARELRVAGRDAEGRAGYWSKPIFADAWTFVPAPLVLSPEDFLPAPGSAAALAASRGPVADVRMAGRLWKDDAVVEGWEFEVPDFNILEGSCSLVVRRGADRASLILHPVESWTYRKRESPGRDGTPKTYLVTLEIPDGAFAGASAAFRDELERLLRPLDREPFRFVAEATTSYLRVESRERSFSGYALFLSADPGLPYRPAALRAGAVAASRAAERYASDGLRMPRPGPYAPADLPALRARLDSNRALAAEIEASVAELEAMKKTASRSRVAYSAFNLLAHATFLYRVDFPKIYTLTRHGDAILAVNDGNAALVADVRTWLDRKVLELARLRIEAYAAAAADLEAGATLAYLPPGFAEDWDGYWRAAGLPLSVAGSAFPGSAASASAALSDEPLRQGFPGWKVAVGEDGVEILLELENCANALYRRGGPAAPDRRLSLDGRLHLLSALPSDRARELSSKLAGLSGDPGAVGGAPVRVEWDGKELTVHRGRGVFPREILFRGLPAPARP